MSELVLDVRLDGFDEPIGVLIRDDHARLAFVYYREYLLGAAPIPLSLSLPLSEEPYADAVCRAFFGNLLQERNDTLQHLMDRQGIARDDIASLLLHLGKDCPGAVSVLAQGSPAAKIPGNFQTDYAPLEIADVEQIVTALHEKEPLPAQMDDPSPIAGVQSKIAIAVLPSGKFALPIRNSGAPTTHILKVSSKRRRNETRLEAIAMALSVEFGVDTASSRNIELAGINCLLVERYDRLIDESGHVVRLHQEDFAQALGLPYSMKYERNGRANSKFDAKAIAAVINASANPARMRLQIITATVFDMLIGNVDAHAKNFSLLNRPDGTAVFSPRYDLVPTAMFEEFTDEFAYSIGAARHLAELTADDFDQFLQTLGIGNRSAQKRLRNQTTTAIAQFLASRIGLISDYGHNSLADLIASNIRHVCHAFDLDIPAPAQNRDMFAMRAGGWLLPS